MDQLIITCAHRITQTVQIVLERSSSTVTNPPPPPPPTHIFVSTGFRLAEECTAPGERSKCTPCLSGQYRDTINYARNCNKCKLCKSTVQWTLPHQIRFLCLLCSGWMSICCLSLFFSLSTTPENDVMVSACNRTKNTVCRCKDGYYKSKINSEEYQCLRCKTCILNEKEVQKCEPNKNHHQRSSPSLCPIR